MCWWHAVSADRIPWAPVRQPMPCVRSASRAQPLHSLCRRRLSPEGFRRPQYTRRLRQDQMRSSSWPLPVTSYCSCWALLLPFPAALIPPTPVAGKQSVTTIAGPPLGTAPAAKICAHRAAATIGPHTALLLVPLPLAWSQTWLLQYAEAQACVRAPSGVRTIRRLLPPAHGNGVPGQARRPRRGDRRCVCGAPFV
jgi:hypothetical protein